MSELPFVKCDNCKKYFFIQCQERTIEYDIVETFFKCPHCKKEYHCYYDDSKTKQIKNRISREKERWYRTRDQTILKTINKSQIKLQRELKTIEKKVRKKNGKSEQSAE